MRATVAASVALAAISLFAGLLTGNFGVGAGLGAGFAVGSLNGVFMLRLLENDAPFVMSSVARLAMVSAVAILLAFVLGAAAWAVLLGVAGAQVVMVAAAVRRGLRS
jgi:hypothetical protein